MKKSLALLLALVLALAVPALAESAAGADMSEPVELTMFSSGWVSTPFPEEDPFKTYVKDTFNVDLNLVVVPDADMSQKVFTAVAAGDDPDFIYYRFKPLMLQLYDQGVLVEDHSVFYEKMPTMSDFTTDFMKTACTMDGKMFAMPRRAEGINTFSFQVRQDWLDALGLSAPTTADELMEVLKQFTFNDPDGNGKDDTYGYGAAGNNAGLGGMWNLRYLFGPTGFYIEDRELKHDRNEQSFEDFLNYVKNMVDEKVIDPDFYSMNNETFDAALYNSRYGVYYAEPLMAKWMENATGNTGAYINVWTNIPCPVGAPAGGKYPLAASVGGYYGIFQAATEDPVKLERLLTFIDQCQYPNDPYWALRWGVGIYDTAVLTPFADDAGLFFPQGDDPRAMAGSLWDYGCFIGTGEDRVKYSPGTEPADLDIFVVEKEQKALGFDRFDDVSSLISYDAGKVENFDLVTEEFAYQYITGQNTDLEGFRKRLDDMGWQEYMEDARQQIAALGLVD